MRHICELLYRSLEDINTNVSLNSLIGNLIHIFEEIKRTTINLKLNKIKKELLILV